ncbi:MAG TPA: Ig-like domain-containing protein, partial [Gemmatimonadales bacterium]|nr:Ig-like domain-containing protein [Gemmatimonadales bacterium]
VVVHFSPAAGSGVATPAIDTTGADGTASALWTLGTGAGVRTLNATAEGVPGPAIGFRATALPGPATALGLSSGGGQSQEAGLQFASALIARVTDPFGNGISGITVTWQVTSGSGSVNAPTSLTTAGGQAAVSVTAGGTPGALQVEASVDSLTGSPVSFDLTVTPAASVIIVGSNFFSPAADTIPAGGLVRWVWNSGRHNVTFDAGPEAFPNSGDRDAPNSYGPLQLTTPGTYSFECTIHPGMTGTITVQ